MDAHNRKHTNADMCMCEMDFEELINLLHIQVCCCKAYSSISNVPLYKVKL